MPGPRRTHVYFLFVVELPSLRAQSIQVVNSAHALARRGWAVRLGYRPAGGDPLEPYGLEPHPGLRLVPLPSGTRGSVALRADIVRWARRHGRDGVFLARSKRYARFASRVARGVPLVVEAHEVDSLQDPARSASHAALEADVLRAAAGLITNCEGVLRGLSWMHRLPPLTRVVHNAWAPGPAAPTTGEGTALAGSLLGTKGPRTVALAARDSGPITVYGAAPDPALVALSGGNLVWGGPVAPGALVDVLRRHDRLVLPLGRGWFGEHLTSPLKAFAYQAARVPFVGADTPALRHAAPGAFEPYAPGDPRSLVAALERLDDPAIRAARLAAARPRTWDQRAEEVAGVLGAV